MSTTSGPGLGIRWGVLARAAARLARAASVATLATTVACERGAPGHGTAPSPPGAARSASVAFAAPSDVPPRTPASFEDVPELTVEWERRGSAGPARWIALAGRPALASLEGGADPVSLSTELVMVDAATGGLLWRRPSTPGGWRSLEAAGDTIAVEGEFAESGIGSALLGAVLNAEGTLVWQRELRTGERLTIGANAAGVALVRPRDCTTSPLDPKTGAARGATRGRMTGPGRRDCARPPRYLGRFGTLDVLTEDVGSAEKALVAFDASGVRSWRASLGHVDAGPEWDLDRGLVWTSEGESLHVRRFDWTTGRVVWRREYSGCGATARSVGARGGALLVHGCSWAELIDPAEGRVLWRRDVGDAAPVLEDEAWPSVETPIRADVDRTVRWLTDAGEDAGAAVLERGACAIAVRDGLLAWSPAHLGLVRRDGSRAWTDEIAPEHLQWTGGYVLVQPASPGPTLVIDLATGRPLGKDPLGGQLLGSVTESHDGGALIVMLAGSIRALRVGPARL